MMRVRTGTVFLILGVALLCLMSSTVFGAQGPRALLVDHGQLNKFRWAVGVMRHSDKTGGQRPCVGVQVLDTVYGGPSDFSQQQSLKACSGLSLVTAPNVVSVTSGEGRRAVEVLGIAVAPAIRILHLDFGVAGTKVLRTKQFSVAQRQSAGVRSLRYAGLCVMRLLRSQP